MKRKCLAVGIILLFVAIAFLLTYTAQARSPETNTIKSSLDSPMKKMFHPSDDEAFFDLAIIWGPFERLGWKSLFSTLWVYNPKPWYNRTINVIGYQIPEHNLVVKKSYWIECHFLHIGIIGQHWLFIIAIGNINAW
jgi:hypothetical protein